MLASFHIVLLMSPIATMLESSSTRFEAHHEARDDSDDGQDESAVSIPGGASRQSKKRLIVQAREQTSCALDPCLWGALPEAITEWILALLPLPALFRCRCVCRRWRTLLSCPRFPSCHGRGLSSFHYLLHEQEEHPAHMRMALIYSRDLPRWFRLPFSLPHAAAAIAAAGGLVCARDRATGSLSVHNPITQSSRPLPPLINKGSSSTKLAFEVGMLMDDNGVDYRVIVWMDEPSPTTQVYYSKSHQWHIKASIDVGGDALSECGVVSGSSFYILVINEYLSIFAYSFSEEKWAELQAPMPPYILYSYLIDQWGSLLMVGAIGKDFPTKGICVWRLEKSRLAWNVVLRMPDQLYKRLTEGFRPFDAFKCAGKGDQICFLVHGHPRILMYDFSRKHWWWSPNVGFRGHFQVIAADLHLDVEP